MHIHFQPYMKPTSILIIVALCLTAEMAWSKSHGPCSQLTLPGATKPKFDLSSLGGKTLGPATTGDGLYSFTFGVCSDIPCGTTNIAVCQNVRDGPTNVPAASFNPMSVVTVPPPPGNIGIGLDYVQPDFVRHFASAWARNLNNWNFVSDMHFIASAAESPHSSHCAM